MRIRIDKEYEVSVAVESGDMHGLNRYDTLEDARANMMDDLNEFKSIYDEKPISLHIFEIEEEYHNDSIWSVDDLEVESIDL